MVAKWAQDNIWYRAEILSVEPSFCNVKFLDYGNTDIVNINNILRNESDIPASDEKDSLLKSVNPAQDTISPVEPLLKNDQEIVDPYQIKLTKIKESTAVDLSFIKIGGLVVAKWAQDNIWYRAEIVSVDFSFCTVKFIDYGNTDNVSRNSILQKESDIPASDIKDPLLKSVNSAQHDVPSVPTIQRTEKEPEVYQQDQNNEISLEKKKIDTEHSVLTFPDTDQEQQRNKIENLDCLKVSFNVSHGVNLISCRVKLNEIYLI